MKSLIPLFPFVAALVLIGCQGDEGPVADDATAPPENVVGDLGTSGLSTPANAASAEAVDQAALPPVTGGMTWQLAADRRSARFGPAEAEPVLTVACDGPALSFTRHDNTTPGTKGTLSFTGGGHASSIPVAGVPVGAAGPGNSEWRGRASGDQRSAVQRSFAGGGPIEVSLGGAPSLVVPSDPAVRALIAGCNG